MIDLYDTTVGKTLRVDARIVDDYLLQLDHDNGYGRSNANMRWHFITGMIEEDDMLPKIHVPFIHTDRVGTRHMFVDVRGMTRSKPKENTLKELLTPRGDGFLMLFIAELLVRVDEVRILEYKEFIYKTVPFLAVFSTRNKLMLDPSEQDILGIYLLVMLINRLQPGYDKDSIVAITARYFFQAGMDSKVIEDILQDDYTVDNLVDVFKAIKKNSDSKKLGNMDHDAFLTLFSGLVYPNHKIHMMMGVESPLLLIALAYYYQENSLYKKSMLYTILHKFNKMLGIDKTMKKIKQVLS